MQPNVASCATLGDTTAVNSHSQTHIADVTHKKLPEFEKKPAKLLRKQVALSQIHLHPWFNEFQDDLAKISFELKSVSVITPEQAIRIINRDRIQVGLIEVDKYVVYCGIRSFQLACTVLPAKTKIDVDVAHDVPDAVLAESLVDQLLVQQGLYRSSDAGALHLVDLFGRLAKDGRFKSVLAQSFSGQATKARFAGWLGLRVPGLYEKSNPLRSEVERQAIAPSVQEEGNA